MKSLQFNRNGGADLDVFIKMAKEIPLLTPEEEISLGQRAAAGCKQAQNRLVCAHLRMLPRVAFRYQSYKIPIIDLVSEGQFGLIRAAEKFDPEKKVKFATYAQLWIRSFMQDYIIKNISIVRINSTKKELFFKLRQAMKQAEQENPHLSTVEREDLIANNLGISVKHLQGTKGRLFGDLSLNTTVGAGDDTEWADLIISDQASPESLLSSADIEEKRRALLAQAMSSSTLNERERAILTARQLRETPKTLGELGKEHGVSNERIRQIEKRALEKVAEAVRAAASPALADFTP